MTMDVNPFGVQLHLKELERQALSHQRDLPAPTNETVSARTKLTLNETWAGRLSKIFLVAKPAS